MQKSRNITIDIVKAFAIIFVVMSHCGSPYKVFFHLFHNSVFFICSGYVCKNNEITSFKELLRCIVKKIQRLYIPFVIWNSFFQIIEFLFYKTYDIKQLVLNIAKGFLFMGGTSLSVAMWFLRILFQVSVLYLLTTYIFSKLNIKNRDKCQCILSIIFCIFGFYMSINGISCFGIDITLSCYILFIIGTLINKNIKAVSMMNKYLVIISSFAIVIFLYSKNIFIDLASNNYGNPLILIISSVASFLLLFEISDMIAKTKVSSITAYIGKNSLSILILHGMFIEIIKHYVNLNWFILSWICVFLSLFVNYLITVIFNSRNTKNIKII